jgi:integrase
MLGLALGLAPTSGAGPMGNPIHKLSARRVATETKPGRHSDGGGLYLVVALTGSRKWLFIFRRQGKQREMGLGAAFGSNAVSLADARERAAECRAELAKGHDPIDIRRERKEQASARRLPSFGEFADQYIEAHRSSWRNEKHVAQWQTTLTTYAGAIRKKPINEVTREDVLAILKPIWLAKNETASRLRGRIEAVLDAAKAERLRDGENPAAWKGNLMHSLPKRQKLQRGHHAAMPYRKVPAFVQSLRQRDATAARALEFLILTAARSGEVLGAGSAEVDFERAIWTVPAARMKAGREHRVPLAPRAVSILREMEAVRQDDRHPLFPGRRGKPLSATAMEMLLRRMKIEDATVHGFRSAFRDWAAEETPFAREIAEAALAHVVGDATERAYRRGDALERRRQLMQAWADYLLGAEGAGK